VLPPFGIGKRIGERSGVTTLLGVPVAPFTATGRELVYRWLPVRDRLARHPNGCWVGEGQLFGYTFCRFRLVRHEAPRC
jgi:hypothetical protein